MYGKGSLGSFARSVVLDDGGHFGEVQASRCHIRAQQHSPLAARELQKGVCSDTLHTPAFVTGSVYRARFSDMQTFLIREQIQRSKKTQAQSPLCPCQHFHPSAATALP